MTKKRIRQKTPIYLRLVKKKELVDDDDVDDDDDMGKEFDVDDNDDNAGKEFDVDDVGKDSNLLVNDLGVLIIVFADFSDRDLSFSRTDCAVTVAFW